MKITKTRIVEIVFGLLLILFGLNGFFKFLPLPEKSGFASEFLHILHQAKYIFPMIAMIMTLTGTLLLSNRGVAFALLMQLPISINIFAFHLFHDFDGLIVAYIIFGLNNFLIMRRLKQYKNLFNYRIINHDTL